MVDEAFELSQSNPSSDRPGKPEIHPIRETSDVMPTQRGLLEEEEVEIEVVELSQLKFDRGEPSIPSVSYMPSFVKKIDVNRYSIEIEEDKSSDIKSILKMKKAKTVE